MEIKRMYSGSTDSFEEQASDLHRIRILLEEYEVSTYPPESQAVLTHRAIVAKIPTWLREESGGAVLVKLGNTSMGCGLLRPPHGVCATPELTKLWVRPIFRRQGIGERILIARLSLARILGYEGVHVVTHRGNTAVLKLYSHHGFQEAPTSSHFVTPELVVLEKNL